MRAQIPHGKLKTKEVLCMSREMICALVIVGVMLYCVMGYFIGRYLANHGLVDRIRMDDNATLHDCNITVAIMWIVSIPLFAVAWPTYIIKH